MTTSIFDAIREHVTAREAAEVYGLQNRKEVIPWQ